MIRPILMLALVGLMLLPGCSGVWMNAEYSKLLDTTADLSIETAKRANAGTLSPELSAAALSAQAGTWYKFQCARDGVKSDPNLPNVGAIPTPLLPAPAAPMPPLPMSGDPMSLLNLLPPAKEVEYD
jgi:hypothetical protein